MHAYISHLPKENEVEKKRTKTTNRHLCRHQILFWFLLMIKMPILMVGSAVAQKSPQYFPQGGGGGTCGSIVVKALRYKPEGCGFDT
jgi:hypothetical protein